MFVKANTVEIGADEDTGEAAEAIIARYPVGSPVMIHYDPGKPARGILEPGPHWDGLSITLRH